MPGALCRAARKGKSQHSCLGGFLHLSSACSAQAFVWHGCFPVSLSLFQAAMCYGSSLLILDCKPKSAGSQEHKHSWKTLSHCCSLDEVPGKHGYTWVGAHVPIQCSPSTHLLPQMAPSPAWHTPLVPTPTRSKAAALLCLLCTHLSH